MLNYVMMEKEFINEFIRILNNKEQEQVQCITSYKLDYDVYVEHVGKLHGIREARDAFKEHLAKYFPST
jgi:hypothetical protein